MVQGFGVKRGLVALAGAAAGFTLAAAPALADLPPGYDVTRVDSPNPAIDGRFGLTIINVGDLNGDGRDDLLTGTDKHGAQNGTGQVAVISGADPAGAPLRVYDQPDTDGNAGGSDRRAGFGNAIGKLADLGSCPGFTGAPGDLCTANPISAGDGVPEHIVASSGIDVDANGDDLGVIYIFDGASGALLKRLQMPAADRAEQTSFASGGDAANDPRYGRTVLNPIGVPPCDQNGPAAYGGPGIALCPGTPPPAAVQNGDITGDDVGDILVGATDYDEAKATAHPQSECATQAGTDDCAGSGRVYVYSGADIAGSNPATVLSTPAETLKNPRSQPDLADPPSAFSNDEQFGIQLIPLGDAGSCGDVTVTDPGNRCLAPSNTFDTEPDFAILANGVDLFGYADVGEALEFDGAKLAVIKDTEYPEPRPDSSWGIAQNGVAYPALGDVAGSTAPDYYASDIQWSGNHQVQGRGLLINGQPSTNGSFREFPSRFVDPTPQGSEQFGLSAAGLGAVRGSGDPRGEIMIGAIGPHNPGTNAEVVNDVHIFDPVTEEVLQTLAAPDAQGGEVFGTSLQPMGDLNNDSFLDYAIGAGFYDLTTTGAPCATPCARAGRVYFFLSDTTPPPEDPVQAGRVLEIEAEKSRVRRGSRVRINGLLEAFANSEECAQGVEVTIQRRKPGDLRYRDAGQATTDADGLFSDRFRVRSTAIFRARVPETEDCLGAVSNRERVAVRRR